MKEQNAQRGRKEQTSITVILRRIIYLDFSRLNHHFYLYQTTYIDAILISCKWDAPGLWRCFRSLMSMILCCSDKKLFGSSPGDWVLELLINLFHWINIFITEPVSLNLKCGHQFGFINLKGQFTLIFDIIFFFVPDSLACTFTTIS